MLLLALAGCTAAPRSSHVASTSTPLTLPSCQYAAAPVTDVPEGPATGAITGAAATSTIAFTRNLTIAPPPRGYRPAITQDQAICELGSAVSVGLSGLGPVALASVTLSGPLPVGVPPYQNRVAWVDFGQSADTVPSCPAVLPEPSAAASPTPPTWPTPRGGPQQVVAVDASTGGSAFYLNEHYTCVGDPPAPTVGVPLQIDSVPWTLASRTAGSLVIRAAWPSCDAFAGNQSVGPPTGVDSFTLDSRQRMSGQIAIRVWRPLGPACGPSVNHDISVTSDVAGEALPATLTRAALGIERTYPRPAFATPAPLLTSPPPVGAADACADPVAADRLLTADAPPGPARGKASDDEVTEGWSLDGDALVVGPPPAGFRPAISAGEAGCQLAFASRADHTPVPAGKLELGTVTVRADVERITAGTPDYQSRVAWLLVTNPLWTSDCPGVTPPAVDPYEVLLLDATTGQSGASYLQHHVGCGRQNGPQVGVPQHRRSVSWSLVSRAKDGSSVVVSASWPACEAFTGIYQQQAIAADGGLAAAAMRDDPTEIRIIVDGPVGAACAAAQRHTITVGPATAGQTLSNNPLHAPVGALDDTGVQ
ncbi:hypothetical protein acdb102_29390 [Acidothermaceae bacterium B102]|nr:hypothetical protein acdb102_29390 [Acidothermaceae bacterium B102]